MPIIKTSVDVTAIVRRYFEGRSLIEVGCGKGYFLEHLQRSGYQVTGIDPAYEGANPDVIRARFEPDLGLAAEGVVLRHVLEHIADPIKFLADIATANGGKGTVYIEVPCFDWTCHHRAWFDIFYEHVNYFRSDDFYRIFGTVHEAGHLFGGQYLYVVADLGTLRSPAAGAATAVEFPEDFLADVKRFTMLPRTGKRRAIWGAASKGVIFSLYMKRVGVEIDVAIDINPAKQGKYLAATGLRIASPEEALQSLVSARHHCHAGDYLVCATRSDHRNWYRTWRLTDLLRLHARVECCLRGPAGRGSAGN